MDAAEKDLILTQLFNYHLKIQKEQWDEAKSVIESVQFITSEHTKNRYIEKDQEYTGEIDPKIGLNQLIQELAEFDSAENFPRSIAGWYTYGYEMDGPFEPNQSGLCLSYYTYKLVDFEKAESLARCYAKSDLWYIENGRKNADLILQKIKE